MRNLRLIRCIYPPIWPFQLVTPLNIGQGSPNRAMIQNKPASGALTQHPLPSLTVPSAILVHGIGDLRAALEAASSLGRALTVLSIPGAAGSAGPAWFHALIQAGAAEFPDVPLTGVLDCTDRPGHALAALRAGCRDLLMDGSVPAWPRVQAIAEASAARLYRCRGPVFDPRFFREPIGACREWLAVNP